jgi:Leucine-rich repeat (LRR) protein
MISPPLPLSLSPSLCQGLSTIPDSIRECQDLLHLDVSANTLGSIPEGLTELRQLRTLALNDCQLEQLPPNIGK